MVKKENDRILFSFHNNKKIFNINVIALDNQECEKDIDIVRIYDNRIALNAVVS